MKQMSLSFFYWFLRNHLIAMGIYSIPMRIPNSIDYYVIVQLNGKLELVILLDEIEYIYSNAIDRKTHPRSKQSGWKKKTARTHWNEEYGLWTSMNRSHSHKQYAICQNSIAEQFIDIMMKWTGMVCIVT